jgi:hypothetical protein
MALTWAKASFWPASSPSTRLNFMKETLVLRRRRMQLC